MDIGSLPHSLVVLDMAHLFTTVEPSSEWKSLPSTYSMLIGQLRLPKLWAIWGHLQWDWIMWLHIPKPKIGSSCFRWQWFDAVGSSRETAHSSWRGTAQLTACSGPTLLFVNTGMPWFWLLKCFPWRNLARDIASRSPISSRHDLSVSEDFQFSRLMRGCVGNHGREMGRHRRRLGKAMPLEG